jgi:hypothetical protein
MRKVGMFRLFAGTLIKNDKKSSLHPVSIGCKELSSIKTDDCWL